jgi:hypothetical protein
MSAAKRNQLLGQVFTSWKEDKCDKLRVLAESLCDCPRSTAFLAEQEDIQGASSPIKYTWLTTKHFRGLGDEDKLTALQHLASGAVNNTAGARATITAIPFRKQALEHLQKVCFFFLHVLFLASAARRMHFFLLANSDFLSHFVAHLLLLFFHRFVRTQPMRPERRSSRLPRS